MSALTSDFAATMRQYFDDVRVRLTAVERCIAEVDRLVAPDFNVFSALRVNEVRLSAMLAELLDPRGRHGQGARFLDLFLGRLERLTTQRTVGAHVAALRSAWSDEGKIRIVTEHRTDRSADPHRRLDILIEGAGWCVGIENKPWAADQPAQLEDYANDLAARCHDKHWILLYLSADGAQPAEQSIPEAKRRPMQECGHYHALSYRDDISDWLRACVTAAEAERVRGVLRDFAAYVESKFTKGAGRREALRMDEIVTHALANEAHCEVAVRVGHALPRLRDRLLQLLSVRVSELVTASGHYTVATDGVNWAEAPSTRYAGLSYRSRHWPARIAVRLEAEGAGATNCIFGVVAPSGPVQDDLRKRLSDRCSEVLGEHKTSADWACYRSLDGLQRDLGGEDALVAMSQKTGRERLACDVASALTALCAAVDATVGDEEIPRRPEVLEVPHPEVAHQG